MKRQKVANFINTHIFSINNGDFYERFISRNYLSVQLR